MQPHPERSAAKGSEVSRPAGAGDSRSPRPSSEIGADALGHPGPLGRTAAKIRRYCYPQCRDLWFNECADCWRDAGNPALYPQQEGAALEQIEDITYKARYPHA